MRENKESKRKLQTSIITTVISTSLVLWLIGTLLFLVYNARKVADFVKENIGFSVIINDNVADADIYKLQKIFDAQTFTKSTRIISKEEAAEELKEELGEDFVEFLGYNPLPASIEVKLQSTYVNPDSIIWIERNLKRYPEIKDVWYQKSLVHYINDNIRKISLIIFGFALLLLIISIVLLNNTIRLAIHSKRLIINTMKLVGATNSFIRTPFLRSGALQGLVSGIIATGLLYTTIFIFNREMPDLKVLEYTDTILEISGLIILFGFVITILSTFFSVNRYLNIKTTRLLYI
ncbi:MAG TPA: permease-like cell division protein FtsX [Salinivirgaceae bacterium]|nr:permease-like cell division protein FtsX [Salinivirgaceae bacterium]